MTKRKNIRARGKTQLSQYFKQIKEGETVAVIDEQSIPSSYPKRIIGMAGTVVGNRGTYKVIKINDGNLEKTFVIHPIHLKKLK
jgi:large subunit ribosomal protein L21e